jgi:hypothetical protein
MAATEVMALVVLLAGSAMDMEAMGDVAGLGLGRCQARREPGRRRRRVQEGTTDS